jgi:hypothetical protein
VKILKKFSPSSRPLLAQKFSIVTRAVVIHNMVENRQKDTQMHPGMTKREKHIISDKNKKVRKK